MRPHGLIPHTRGESHELAEMKPQVLARWTKLNDEDLRRINGDHDELIDTLAERYGWAKEQAERQVKEFEEVAGAKFARSSLGGSSLLEEDEEPMESTKGKKSKQRK